MQIHLREANRGDLLDALEAGDLDLVILARVVRRAGGDLRRAARSGLVREKWLDDEIILVGAPGVDARPLGNTRAGVGIALVSRRAVERLYLVHRGRNRLPPRFIQCCERSRQRGDHFSSSSSLAFSSTDFNVTPFVCTAVSLM